MNRIRSLDGWRGIAILLVITDHVSRPKYVGHIWASLGNLGVDIFFVLSGYIITARLIEEREKTSTINLSSFYIRRAFRILPLVCLYLGALYAISLFVDMDLRPSQLAASLFFFRNYQRAANPDGIFTSHFWSLSIEEHFYLLWPLLLLKLKNKRAAWVGGVAACLCAAWRAYDVAHPDGPIGRFLPGATAPVRDFRTDVRLDGLFLGCLLAILLTYPTVRAFLFRNCPKEMPLVLALFLLLNEQRTDGLPALGNYLLIVGMVTSTLIVHEGLAFKLLNSRFLVTVGVISYSLYVWQQLFLVHPFYADPMGPLGRFPLNLLCAFAVAACSYYFIEKPINGMGHRLAKSKARESFSLFQQTGKDPEPEG